MFILLSGFAAAVLAETANFSIHCSFPEDFSLCL